MDLKSYNLSLSHYNYLSSSDEKPRIKVTYLICQTNKTYLKHIGVGVFRVLHNDCLTAAEGVRNGVLAGVEDGLAAVRCLHHVMLRTPHPVGLRSPIQHEFAASASSLARG